ncbi:MAG: hypothetical protein ABWY36_02180 [Leifsonia sp.]
MTFLTTVLAEGETVDIGMPSIFYGLIALVIFAALAIVVFSFRDVAHRHEAKAQAYAAAHGGGHGQPGGGH